jgi:hypothetical protein
MIVIDAPHFYAAVIFSAGIVVRAAPILKYMIGWRGASVVRYCKKKNWKYAPVV